MKPLFLKAGEKLPTNFLEKLKTINKRKKQETFADYKKNLKEILGDVSLGKQGALDEKHKHFLGGFILGEASINVSLKRKKAMIFGLSLDPQFNVTQHVNQSSHLMACLNLFQTGRIYYKSGSNATLVYVIDNRRSIEEKVVPFWEKYIAPRQPLEEKHRFTVFKSVLISLEKKEHQSLKTFKEKLLPLWDALRKQQGQSNESFANLESAQLFVQAKADNLFSIKG